MPSVQPFARIPVPTEGLVISTPTRATPPNAVVDSENWFFVHGAFRTRPGVAVVTAPLAPVNPPTFLSFFQVDHPEDWRLLVGATERGWMRFDHTNQQWVNITDQDRPLSGSRRNPTVFRTFKSGEYEWILGTNGADAPKAWRPGMSVYRDFGGGAPVSRAIAIAANRVLLGHEKTVVVSAFNDFDSGWDSVLTAILGETPGDIVAMVEMGALMTYIFKDDAIYLAVAQGAASPFRFELRQSYIAGPPGARLIVPLPTGGFLFVSKLGHLFFYDGASGLREVNPSFQMWVHRNCDVTNLELGHGVFDPERNGVWFFLPGFSEGGNVAPNYLGIYVDSRTWAIWPMRFARHMWTGSAAVHKDVSPVWEQMMGPWGSTAVPWESLGANLETFLLGAMDGCCYEMFGHADFLHTSGSIDFPIAAHFQTGMSDHGDLSSAKAVLSVEHLVSGQVCPAKFELIGDEFGGPGRVISTWEGNVGGGGRFETGHRVWARAVAYRLTVEAKSELVWVGAQVHGVKGGPR